MQRLLSRDTASSTRRTNSLPTRLELGSSGSVGDKLEFFCKHWSLIIFQHAEQIAKKPVARKAAEAALRLRIVPDGQRIYVFSRAFLDLGLSERMNMLKGLTGSAKNAKRKHIDVGEESRKRARTSKITNATINKSPSLDSDDDSGMEENESLLRKFGRGTSGATKSRSKHQNTFMPSDDEETIVEGDEDDEGDVDDEDRAMQDGNDNADEEDEENNEDDTLHKMHMNDDDDEIIPAVQSNIDVMAKFNAMLNNLSTPIKPVYLRTSEPSRSKPLFPRKRLATPTILATLTVLATLTILGTPTVLARSPQCKILWSSIQQR